MCIPFSSTSGEFLIKSSKLSMSAFHHWHVNKAVAAWVSWLSFFLFMYNFCSVRKTFCHLMALAPRTNLKPFLETDRPAAISYQRSIEPKFKQCSNDLKTLVVHYQIHREPNAVLAVPLSFVIYLYSRVFMSPLKGISIRSNTVNLAGLKCLILSKLLISKY